MTWIFSRFISTSFLVLTVFMHSEVNGANSSLRLAVAAELTGSGSFAGINFRNGVLLAAKEINASGGILGAQIEVVVADTQTKPDVAKSVVQKAVDDGAFVVFGPVFTGSVMSSMEVTRKAEVPQFIGGEGAAITQQGNPYVFRTSLTQSTAMPKLAYYIADTMKLKAIAFVYINNDFGRGGRDSLLKSLDAVGTKAILEVAVEPGQKDFVDSVAKVMKSEAEAVVIYANEEESAGILKQLRTAAWKKPIIGETTLIGQKVIELAGGAANGIISHLGLTTEAPIPNIRMFKAAYEAEFKSSSDHNGMKGYSGVYIMKTALEKVGRLDRKALANILHGIKLRTDNAPGVLMYTEFDGKGDLDRMSFMMKVENGKQVVVSYLPPLSFMTISRKSTQVPAVDFQKKK